MNRYSSPLPFSGVGPGERARGGSAAIRKCGAALAPLFFAAAGVRAADIQSLAVSHDGLRYKVAMSVRLQAPAAAAYAAFALPANLPRINPAVQQVTILQHGGGGQDRIYTEVRVCAMLYCKLLRQTQDMRYTPRPDGGDLEADIVAADGDFSYGHARWQFRSATGATTQLRFEAELQPAFWIPPVVGPWLVERSLRQEAERTSAGIERLAPPAAVSVK